MFTLTLSHCGSTDIHRDSLRFVQEVARFVASHFCWNKVTRGVWKAFKSSNKVAKLVTQGGSMVRRPCQSTIVGAVCAELLILTGTSEQPHLRKGLKNGDWKKHWVDFYHYRMDVIIFIIIGYTHFQHTFMFKQLLKRIWHQMTPLKCLYLAWDDMTQLQNYPCISGYDNCCCSASVVFTHACSYDFW